MGALRLACTDESPQEDQDHEERVEVSPGPDDRRNWVEESTRDDETDWVRDAFVQSEEASRSSTRRGECLISPYISTAQGRAYICDKKGSLFLKLVDSLPCRKIRTRPTRKFPAGAFFLFILPVANRTVVIIKSAPDRRGRRSCTSGTTSSLVEKGDIVHRLANFCSSFGTLSSIFLFRRRNHGLSRSVNDPPFSGPHQSLVPSSSSKTPKPQVRPSQPCPPPSLSSPVASQGVAQGAHS